MSATAAKRAFDTLPLVLSVTLALSLACSLSIRQGHADTPIAPDAESVQPLGVGDSAPTFVVQDVDGENVVFDPENLARPVILITFRGGWCPFCNLHLSELRHVIPELGDHDIDVYFLSGDRPDQLIAGLRPETQDDVNELGYTLYSDASASAAQALGIAFRSDASLAGRLEDRGRDVEGSSLAARGILPVPAVFIVDAKGRIAYTHVNADHRVRLSADELLEAAANL
ncbi:MAG: peroxiredoxin-like family protein [Woeseiaceae bacterium]|nr:peroxiredoxin-like family protein [Woeseiaceae bacterium]